jgi:hypothetical protein
MFPKPLKSVLQIGILLFTLAMWIIKTGFHGPIVLVGYTVCSCSSVNVLDVRDWRFVRDDWCLRGCDVLWSGRNLTAKDSTVAI